MADSERKTSGPLFEKPPEKPLELKGVEKALEKVQGHLDEEYRDELSGKKEQEAREKERVALRDEAISKFGKRLGKAYFNYLWGDPTTPEVKDQQRNSFAHAIIEAFETESHGERVRAIEALLGALEAKIKPVAEEAERADLWNRRIGIGD